MHRIAQVLLIPIFAVCGYARDPLQIAIVHSYHEGFPWTQGVEQGFLKKLDRDLKLNVIDRFYLDTKRSPSQKYKNAKKILQDLRQLKFDLLFVSDDDAFNLVASKFFNDKQVRVVFCGVNSPLTQYGNTIDQVNKNIPQNVAGVMEVYNLLPLLKLIRDILPKTRYLTLFFDRSSTSIGVYNHYQRELLSAGATQIPELGFIIRDIIFSNDASLWKRKIIAGNPKNDAFIFFPFSQVKHVESQNPIPYREFEHWILSNNHTPEFTSHSLSLNLGFFATVGIQAEEHGEDAAYKALSLIEERLSQVRISGVNYARLNLNYERAKHLEVPIPFELFSYSYSLVHGQGLR